MAFSTTTFSVTYDGNGSTSTAYTIPFPFLSADHITAAVSSDGEVAPVPLSPSAYTVTRLADGSGGSLVTVAAVIAPAEITISRLVPLTQPTTLPLAGPLPAASLETALDRLAMQVQQLNATFEDFEAVVVPTGSYSGAVAQRVSTAGIATDYLQAADTNAARQTAVRAALAAAEDNDVIRLGSGQIPVTGTALSASLAGGTTGVKLELSEGTVLLYATYALAAADRALFNGVRRNLRNFGAVGGDSTAGAMSQNVLAWETARATGENVAPGEIGTDGSDITAVELVLDDGGPFYFNAPLHCHGNLEVDMVGYSRAVFGDNFAPSAGVVIGTFTAAASDICTLALHKLAHGQRVRVSTSAADLPLGLVAATDYYVSVINKDTFKLHPAPAISLHAAVDIQDAGTGTHTLTAMERIGVVVDRPNIAGNSNTTHNVRFGTVSVSSTATGNENFTPLAWRSAQVSQLGIFVGTYKERGALLMDLTSGVHEGLLYLVGTNGTDTGPHTRGTPALHLDGCTGVTLNYISAVTNQPDTNVVLTGSIDATVSTTVTGVGTLFTTELVVGDQIVVGGNGTTVTGETRTVTAIASNTSLTVNTEFSDLADDATPEKLSKPTILITGSNHIIFGHWITEDCTSGVKLVDSQACRLGNGYHSGRAIAGSYGVAVIGDAQDCQFEPLITVNSTYHIRDITPDTGSGDTETQILCGLASQIRRGYRQRLTARVFEAMLRAQFGGDTVAAEYATFDQNGVLQVNSSGRVSTLGSVSFGNSGGDFTWTNAGTLNINPSTPRAVNWNNGQLTLSATGEVNTTVAFKVPAYTVATLPSAATAGRMIYVSDEAGGAVIAFSDGTNWRRVTDRAIVS